MEFFPGAGAEMPGFPAEERLVPLAFGSAQALTLTVF